MSSVHRILTGLEFVPNAKLGHLDWSADTEDLVRLSVELARVTRSEIAFAAVARPPREECDCGSLDCWCAEAEEAVERFVRASSAGDFRMEQGAWFGDPAVEWPSSAAESEMDLLIVSGTGCSETARQDAVAPVVSDITWPALAKCPVWYAGREPDRLEAQPPLIVFCDDLTDEAARHLPLAVELAGAWSARLLIVHPLAGDHGPLTPDDDDQLRQVIFGRLSRTDFRTLTHGTLLRLLPGPLDQILAQVSAEQIPNLVVAGVNLVETLRPQWRGHLMLWPTV